jgi:hypothetical protein
MSRAALRFCSVSSVIVLLAAAAPALADLAATAVLSTSSASSPYNYTIDLHNTGTTNIGTLWFSWDAGSDYNFMPSSPTGIVAPAGWTAQITHVFPGDGYGIEYQNVLGSLIAPGGHGTFKFASTNSPTTMMGLGWYGGNNVTTTWVYSGAPFSDAGFRFVSSVSTVPEPMSLLLLASGGAAGMLLVQRYRRAA